MPGQVTGVYATGGVAEDVVLVDDLAIVLNRTDLRVYDLSGDGAPVLLGSCLLLGRAVDLDYEAPYAVVANKYIGLQVVDLGDPTHPVLVSATSLPMFAVAVAAGAGRAFVACDDGATCSLDAFDLTDPAHPIGKRLADYTCSLEDDDAGTLCWHDGRLYWGRRGGFIDMVEPTSQDYLYHEVLADLLSPRDICGLGSQLWVLDYAIARHYRILAGPPYVESFRSVLQPPEAFSLAAVDSFVIIGTRNEGALWYDMNAPAGHRLCSSVSDATFVCGIDASHGHVVAASEAAGLLRFSDIDVATPRATAHTAASPYLVHLAAAGSHLYLFSGYSHRMSVYDLSIEATLEPCLEYIADDYLLDIAVAGDLAYVANAGDGLLVLNIDDPCQPEPVSSTPLPINCARVACDGHRCFAFDYFGRWAEVDVSDPAQPAVLATGELAAITGYFRLAGDRLYMIDGSGWLRIFDVGVPGTLSPISSLSLWREPEPFQLGPSCLLVGDDDFGLRIIDISDETSPYVLTEYPVYGPTCGLWYRNRTAYLADRYGQVHVLDLSDLAAPVQQAVVRYDDEEVWLAGTDEGLAVARRTGGSLWRANLQCSAWSLAAPELSCGQNQGQRIFYWTDPETDRWQETCLFRRPAGGAYEAAPRACTRDGWLIEPAEGDFVYTLRCRNSDGELGPPGNEVHPSVSAVALAPAAVAGLSASPNPFNAATEIAYTLAADGRVQVRIYDLAGRCQRRLVDAALPAGEHRALWNGRDDAGRTLPAGCYLVRLTGAGRPLGRKVVLLP